MVSMFGAEGDLWKWKRGEKKNQLLWLIFHLRLIVLCSSGEGPGTALTLSALKPPWASYTEALLWSIFIIRRRYVLTAQISA